MPIKKSEIKNALATKVNLLYLKNYLRLLDILTNMNSNYLSKVILSFFTAVLCLFTGFSQESSFEHFKNIKPRNIGPAGMSGRVTAIDVNLSDPSQVFVGTASGGVWMSNNGGIDWTPIFDDQRTLSIGAIKINQSNPAEIWVGTGEGNPRNSQNSGAGVYRSIDGARHGSSKG